MTYADVIAQLGIDRVCLGGCGLNAYRHKGSLFLGTIHWQERRMTRRGLRRFLLLVAKRERLQDPEFLNDKYLRFFHLWWEERRAGELAARLSIRFPVEFSRLERLQCLALISGRRSYSASYPAITEWARRGDAYETIFRDAMTKVIHDYKPALDALREH